MVKENKDLIDSVGCGKSRLSQAVAEKITSARYRPAQEPAKDFRSAPLNSESLQAPSLSSLTFSTTQRRRASIDAFKFPATKTTIPPASEVLKLKWQPKNLLTWSAAAASTIHPSSSPSEEILLPVRKSLRGASTSLSMESTNKVKI